MKYMNSAEEMIQTVNGSFSENVTLAEICRKHGIYNEQSGKCNIRTNLHK